MHVEVPEANQDARTNRASSSSGDRTRRSANPWGDREKPHHPRGRGFSSGQVTSVLPGRQRDMSDGRTMMGSAVLARLATQLLKIVMAVASWPSGLLRSCRPDDQWQERYEEQLRERRCEGPVGERCVNFTGRGVALCGPCGARERHTRRMERR
jgi:hypothetical protein